MEPSIAGKYIIVKNLVFDDYMKDEQGVIILYDNIDDAQLVCGIYEFPEALILKIEQQHLED